jgi:hypothetical protein
MILSGYFQGNFLSILELLYGIFIGKYTRTYMGKLIWDINREMNRVINR